MKSGLVHIVILSVLAVLFLSPILRHITYWGIDDWHHRIMNHAVARESVVEHGQWPLWNPYEGGGSPDLGNPVSSCFSPLFVLILLWGPVIGIKLMALFCMAFGLIGTFKLAREWRISPYGAYLAAFIFMCSSHFPLKIAEGTAEYYAQCWVPWILLFASRLLKQPRKWVKYSIWSAIFFSLICWQGVANDLLFDFILFTLFLCIFTVQFRQSRTIAGLLLVIILFIILSSVKLLPVLETGRSMWRRTGSDELQAGEIAVLPAAFLGREQVLDSPVREKLLHDPHIWNWEEYGSYVGWGSIALAAIGLCVWRRKRVMWGIILVFFCFVYLGHLAPVDLWYWIHKLPLADSLYLPSRCSYIIALVIAFLAGYGLTKLNQYLLKFPWRRSISIGLIALIPVLTFFDLMDVSRPILKGSYPRRPERFKKGPFTQTASPLAIEGKGREKTPYYRKYLQNLGQIIHGAPGGTSNAVPMESPSYRGEWYLLEEGLADYCRLLRFSPNAVRLEVFTEKANRVVLNQNYFPGWRVSGLPDARTEMYRGKISVRVPPGRHKLKIYYWPRTFVWGLTITLLSIGLCAVYLIRPFPKPWFLGAAVFLFMVCVIYLAVGIQVTPEIKRVKRAFDAAFRGDTGEAIDGLRASLAYYPDSVEVRASLRRILQERWEESDSGSLEEMINQLRELIRLRPDDPARYIDLGTAYLKQGSWQKAARQFGKALRMKLDSASPGGDYKR